MGIITVTSSKKVYVNPLYHQPDTNKSVQAYFVPNGVLLGQAQNYLMLT